MAKYETIRKIQLPNPDKPELNIDDFRLKICGIALRGVGATTPTSRRLRSVYSIKINRVAYIFNLAMA
ncbi:MAG: hypothetical protein ACQ9MH_24345 [Nitrospinales bacterium]